MSKSLVEMREELAAAELSARKVSIAPLEFVNVVVVPEIAKDIVSEAIAYKSALVQSIKDTDTLITELYNAPNVEAGYCVARHNDLIKSHAACNDIVELDRIEAALAVEVNRIQTASYAAVTNQNARLIALRKERVGQVKVLADHLGFIEALKLAV